MDIFILVVLAVGLFALALLVSASWSIYMAWRKANEFGLSVNVVEARALAKFFELEKSFIEACIAFKKLDPKVSVRDIVDHHMADGDTYRLLTKWKNVRQNNVNISFKSLILYDLGGKEIDGLVSAQTNVFEIVIDDIKESKIKVDYQVKFRINSESAAWIVPDLTKYKSDIRDKIVIAILAGDLTNTDSLSTFIIESYLNKKFWTDLCHGEVLEQKIIIS